MSTWANHPDPQQRKTIGTDPIRFARDLRLAKSPCLHDFELFVAELLKAFGDQDLEEEGVAKLLTECRQGYFHSD